MTEMFEFRAFGLERADFTPSRSRQPSEYMKRSLQRTILRELDFQIAVIAQMKALQESGQEHSTEFRRLRLDHAWSVFRMDGAQQVETRAFGQHQETR
jgi:hypothetical protein